MPSMSFLPRRRRIPFSVPALMLAAALGACGQKGALYLPETPAAAQRATLPQTVFGTGSGSATEPASRTAPPAPPPPALPNLPDIQ